MAVKQRTFVTYGLIGLFAIFAPMIAPNYTSQISVMWIMVLMAATWDVMGGQMGYNSLGNIAFFGVGMYASAITQIGMVYDVAEYTAAFGAIKVEFTETQYYSGFFLGMLAGGLSALVLSAILGLCVVGLRGPYFAIGTLGIAVAAGQLVGAWEYVGGGGGISMPVFPGEIANRSLFFYTLNFGLAILAHFLIRWLFSTQFGLAVNAIRDDEDKAEAMGIHTGRYKLVGWGVAAFFLGASGAAFGNMIGFIEPVEVAFPTTTFGIFMVAMSLLGGKGTLWGPILGAVLFHVVKETTWTILLGWQWVALGAIIIVNIVFFQQGIMGWLQTKYPHWFGIVVDKSARGERGEGA